MFAPMMAAASGGNVKSGTTNATSAAQSTITIDTGLSQVNRFVWFAKNTNNAYENAIIYDRNVGASAFSTAVMGWQAGQYNTAFADSGYNTPVIKSISGGTVTIVTARNGNSGILDAGYWYAE